MAAAATDGAGGAAASSRSPPNLSLASSSDEASCTTATDQASSVDGSEGRAARLAAIQETLHQIFEYYSVPSATTDTRVLTAARFNKVLLDSSVIDDRLSNAKADLVFAKVCGHASVPMNADQFLDAIVQLAKQKFPQLPRVQGILKLYFMHFATFTAAQEESGGGLAAEIVEVMAEARTGLQALYRIYFLDVAGIKSTGPVPTNFQSLVQDAWVQLLSDYEVLPEFAQKPMVFAALREVLQLKSLTQHMRQQILGDDGQDLGRVFTYVHFALALVALGRRCFADFGAASLVRLFQWMDDSKGHVLAASRGTAQASGLRILAGAESAAVQLAFYEQAGEMAARRSSSRPLGSTSGRASTAGGRQSLSVGALRKSIGGLRGSQASSASGGPPPPEWNGRSSTVGSPSTILARAAQLTEALGGAVDCCGSARAEALVHEIFVHYAAQGDPHNQSHLSLLNFRHFLRDCGLVASEGGRSDFYEFVPAERVQQARKSLGGSSVASPPSTPTGPLPTALRRASSIGSSAGGAQRRASGAGSSFRGSISKQGPSSPTSQSSTDRSPPSKRASVSALASSKDLPLQVYQQPPLTPVDADLIFVQAIQGTEAPAVAQRDLARRRQSSFATPSPASGSERPGQRTRMTSAAFALAVQTLSIAVFRGGDEEAELREIMEEFCTEVLDPLSKVLLGSVHQEVKDAEALLTREEAILFTRSRPGLERIFAHYARTGSKASQQHWTSDDISKFVRDFGLAAELSQRPLQQIFRVCASHERFDSKELSFSAFQIALVVMAQRIHSSFKYNPLDKVVLMFHRLNTAAREEAHVGPKPPNTGSLIPGLPSLAALGPQDAPISPSGSRPRSGSVSSISTAASTMRRQAGGVSVKRQPPRPESWAGLMDDEEAAES